MRRILCAAVALAAIHAVPADAKPGCRTRACLKRVCRSEACHRRVWRRMHPEAVTASASDRTWLRSVRMCESGGDYATNTGNGFYGAYQFTLSSWHAVGGVVRPDLASPGEQDRRALRLRALQGVGAWPVCG